MVAPMTPRNATEDDLDDIVELHLQAWEETYPNLLPRSAFEARNRDRRRAIWGDILGRKCPVSYLPGIGFAHMGGNRDDEWRAAYPRELYSYYTLRHAHGTGAAQALLTHAIGADPTPFTATVLKGNDRAIAFYKKIGGTLLCEKSTPEGEIICTDYVFGISVPIQSQKLTS